ncbi:hypothetical protein EDB19DRAFT_1754081, partial [Suillus lakei]
MNFQSRSSWIGISPILSFILAYQCLIMTLSNASARSSNLTVASYHHSMASRRTPEGFYEPVQNSSRIEDLSFGHITYYNSVPFIKTHLLVEF